MFRMIGALLIALAATGAATTGLAQQTPATKGAVPPAGPAAAPSIPGANDVLATVTSHGQTDKITKGDIVNFLSRYPLPAPRTARSPTRRRWTCSPIRC